jgi:hypothetical protein
MANRRFNMPNNIEDLRKMVDNYRIRDEPEEKRLEPIIINEKDNLVLNDEINDTLRFLINLKSILKNKEENIQNLMNTENNLQNIETIYKSQERRMDNELYEIQKTDGVNKRLVEFYNKDYGLKSILKKYLKYIYFILIGILVILLIYKKQHKNKKIVAFLVFLIIFPFLILKMIFNMIVKNIGHFKLDVLYTFFIFIIIGIGFGGFKIVKKLLQIITTPTAFISMDNITMESKNDQIKKENDQTKN